MNGEQERPASPLPEVALARAVQRAVLAIPGVAALSQGRFARARTLGIGGEVVEGIQVTPGAGGVHVEIHLVVDLVPLPPLAAAVRAAAGDAAYRTGVHLVAVDVWIDGLRPDAHERGDGAR